MIQPKKLTTKMTIEQIVTYFNEEIKEIENYLCITRSSTTQINQCRKLDALQYNAALIKKEAIRRASENVANLLLGFECVIGAIRSELLMWVLIKKDMPNQAWDRLIAAQMGYLDASRSDKGFAHCLKRLRELEQIESQIFPPQVFVSAGFVSKKIDCSICGERYSKCEHLQGMPYMGLFCEVIHRDPVGDHVAIVKIPADKRCRIVSVKTKDGNRDKLSWEVTPYKEGEKFEENEPLEAEMIFMSMDRYPYYDSTDKVIGTMPNI
ncbi:hypothetical protein [Chromobacterium vaccinii]|uniref:hypothetical protein n=1 Tax=Chromobacterium vaccinii TaxID=1108595 RepID=UPI000B092943|nr:hypothetical protein [Chromobacterium vaccinii]